MPLLRGANDHRRDVLPLEPAPGSTSHVTSSRGSYSVIRHGPHQTRAAAIALRPTAQAALGAGDSVLKGAFDNSRGSGNRHIERPIGNVAPGKPCCSVAAIILSGHRTSKSP